MQFIMLYREVGSLYFNSEREAARKAMDFTTEIG